MINFTVGPVQSSEAVLEIGSRQVPYFRTPEFSAVMKDSERMMLGLAGAPEGSRAVFLTGSGTASMESVVMNVLNADDRAIVVDGGSFGHRFCELCGIHGIAFDRVVLEPGRALREDDLAAFDGDGAHTAFLVNLHETSTGVLYDLDLISAFCERNGLLLVVDAISAFLADPICMCKSGVDVMITGSQKALACPPGVSVVVMSPRALGRVDANPTKCMYLDLKSALKNGERGQTPFTPAVGTLLQINARLHEIEDAGGAEAEIARIAELAGDFRSKIDGLPFEIASERMSNAVTPLRPTTAKATDIFAVLKDEYGIWVCPNGGELAETLFRVGHIGALGKADNSTLVSALKHMRTRGII